MIVGQLPYKNPLVLSYNMNQIYTDTEGKRYIKDTIKENNGYFSEAGNYQIFTANGRTGLQLTHNIWESWNLNGITGKLIIPKNTLIYSGDIKGVSISFWLYSLNSWSGTNDLFNLVSKSIQNYTYTYTYKWLYNYGFKFIKNDFYGEIYTPLPDPYAQWIFHTLTIDYVNCCISVYQNGVLVALVKPINTSINALYLDSIYSHTGWAVSWAMSDFKIFNKVLNVEEIQTLTTL